MSRQGAAVEWALPDGSYQQKIEPPPRLIMIGAVHIAVALVQLASQLGFATLVIDPRCAFADLARFPVAPDQLLAEWPVMVLPKMPLDAQSFAVVLGHDPKIDDPAIEIFLRSSVAYIGALGGRTSRLEREDRLRGRGFSDEDMARIHSPAGLAIGAQTPEEIALSILSQIVQVHRGG
jgi:xanthine dehydrogenase accessory factor